MTLHLHEARTGQIAAVSDSITPLLSGFVKRDDGHWVCMLVQCARGANTIVRMLMALTSRAAVFWDGRGEVCYRHCGTLPEKSKAGIRRAARLHLESVKTSDCKY